MSETFSRQRLPNYYAILDGKRDAWYLRCKNFNVRVSFNRSLDILWQVHDEAVRRLKNSEGDDGSGISLLELKIEIASRLFRACVFCERRCRVNRMQGEKGVCGVNNARIASEFAHWGEEPELIPSYTLFFSGCTFKCVYCQNHDISQNYEVGTPVEEHIVARMIERRKEQGLRNTNWVGGEPTPNLLFILKVLQHCNANMPQVWNSNMYMSTETMKLLDGVIDLYLADFKYGTDECALRLSKVKNYVAIVSRNHKFANEQCELIIRHLVLPNHVECCSKPLLRWIAENLDNSRVRVNVMAQYRPEYRAREYEEIRRGLKASEFNAAYQFAEQLGLSLTD